MANTEHTETNMFDETFDETVEDSKAYVLTTIDNPFNPFDDFIKWYKFDMLKGYDTCGRLARLVDMSPDRSEKEIEIEVDDAMMFLIEHDLLGIYKRVSRDDYDEDTGLLK